MNNWKTYLDHIFCMTYLPKNKYDKINTRLLNTGIDTKDADFFSWYFDIDDYSINDSIQLLKQNFINYFNDNCDTDFRYDNDNYKNKYTKLGINTYHILKIAQYFNYDRIGIVEDDAVFIKDNDYIKSIMETLSSQSFDMCQLQTTFDDCEAGNVEYLLTNNNAEIVNANILRQIYPAGVYGGAFIILTKSGINKVIDLFETNKFVCPLDALELIKHKTNLDCLFLLKPLCIQTDFYKFTDEWLHTKNINMNSIYDYDYNE